jgi:hypothetical protein
MTRGGSENGFQVGQYDSIKGFTRGQVDKLMEDSVYHHWIIRKSKNRKRMRYTMALVVKYDMVEDKWYYNDEIKNLLLKHDSRGMSSMNMTNQRVGMLMRAIVGLGKAEMKFGLINKKRVRLYKVIK